MSQGSRGVRTGTPPGGAQLRWISRGGWTLALVALVGGLGWLLARPFWHPRTHLVLLAGDVAKVDTSPAAIPAEYVVEDLREFLKLKEVLHRGIDSPPKPLILGSLGNPAEMPKLAERLREQIAGDSDVLLMYAAAQGLSQDGDAWLLASGADPDSALGGRYRLSGLLASLKACSAGTKLLIIEAGRVEYDPLRGLLDNDFSSRLAEQVEQLEDGTLWVLLSHSAGQRSHLSPALRRSIFGYFVAKGLEGAADQNHDQSVDLQELSRFVSSSASGWVRQTTGGAAEQTPRLIWGGGQPWPRSLPVLLAVQKAATSDTGEVEGGKAAESSSTETAPAGRIVSDAQRELDALIATSLAQATPQGRMGQYARDVARQTFTKALEKAPKTPGAAAEAKPAPGAAEGTAAKAEADKTAATALAGKDASSEKNAQEPAQSKADAATVKTEGKAAATAKDEKNASPAAAKEPAGVAEAPKAVPVSPAQLQARLHRAWQLRDELASAGRAQVRPVDYAPHLWRDLEERLLAAERELYTGYLVNSAELARLMDEAVTALEWLGGERAINSPNANSIIRRFAAAHPGRAWAKAQPHSLALAELIAREGGPSLASELAALLAQLGRQIASGNRADLQKLAQSLKPEHDRWIELRVVRLLAERSELDWRLVHLVLAVTRASEQAAAAGAITPAWQREEMKAADEARLAAERTLLARSTFDRDALISALSGALSAYQSVISNLTSIVKAERLTHDVWHRLPHYLAWNALAWNTAANGSSGMGPTADEILALIADLDALEKLLESPAADKIAALEQAAVRLTAAQANVERGLHPQAIEQLLAEPVATGEAWRMEVLLQTPLASAEIRAALLATLPEVDAALASQIKQLGEAKEAASNANHLRTDVDRFAARANLQHKMWQAALRGVANPDFEALDQAWRAWSNPNLAKSGTEDASIRAGRERLETALADLMHDLPARVERGVEQEQDLSSPANRGPRMVRLAAWERAFRLIDPRLLAQMGRDSPAELLANAAAYELLAWLRERAEHAAEDAPPVIGAYLHSVAEDYRLAAASIPQQPTQRTGAYSPLELTGPERVALTYEAEQQADFVIRNTSSVAASAWVVADWEPELVALTSPAAVTIYPWSEWDSAGGQQRADAAQPIARKERPSLQLAPGQALTIPLRLVRRKAALAASHVVLRVITEQHAARHDLTIDLPRPEDVTLAIAGAPARWTPVASGITIFPFPNRTSSFVLQLANGQAAERKLDVEVFPLLSLPPHGIPNVPLSASDSARLRGELSVGPLVAEVRAFTLSPGGKPVSIPLAPPAPKTPPPPAPVAAAESKAKTPAPIADKPPPVPLTQGLLVVITDLADKQQSFKQIEIAPQRPERYIRAQVRYRAARERIEIKVAPQDPALLPADGVRIHGEIAEPLEADAVRQLDAVLKPSLGDAEMHVEVPEETGGAVTLRLTVDDYPRALYYRVPTSGETGDVPEDVDLLAVRVVELPKGTVYQPPTASIPVRIEIDAPASAQKNPPLRVEVGIDRNRDRELTGDEFVVLTADRQVAAALVGISKAGELEIETRVQDFTVKVPAAAVVNGRVNVLAHVVLGENEAWSDPREIVIDAQPPRVSAVELRPDRVAVIGTDLVVSALADDLGLSGVAKLEAMFDLDRSGQFGPMAKPAAGAMRDDGSWAAKVPTAGLPSGAQRVLVRAIDRAGNASEPVQSSVRLLTSEEAKADTKAKNSADITGTVMYGDQPQAGMKVTLAADTGAPPAKADKKKKKEKSDAKAPLASATTDAQGQFKFPKVAPGKYMVTATGLIKNSNRFAEQAVAFEKPADVQALTLKLK